jgi:hypothetical protein
VTANIYGGSQLVGREQPFVGESPGLCVSLTDSSGVGRHGVTDDGHTESLPPAGLPPFAGLEIRLPDNGAE